MATGTNVPREIADPWPELTAFVATLAVLLGEVENRQKRRSKKAQAAYDQTLMAVVAAIATNAMSEVPPFDGTPISLADHDYVGGPFSVKALRTILEGLEQLGYVVRRNGFYNKDKPEDSFCTSFRHTGDFRDLAIAHGIKQEDTVKPPADVIHLNEPDGEHSIPADVEATRAIVERYNAFIDQFDIELPASGWAALARQSQKAGRLWKGMPNIGFNSRKKHLRRVFSNNYQRGGRLYGPWWTNAKGKIRRQMTINGEAVVELDFASLHPTIIASQKRMNSKFSPYDIEGFPSRKAAKKMFNRILNASKPVQYDGRYDKKAYGDSGNFYRLRDHMLAELEPMSDLLQCDYGVKLQKLDSEIALRVIERCMDLNIPVCPVHDSFIVPASRADDVELIMRGEFRRMFDWNIDVSRKE